MPMTSSVEELITSSVSGGLRLDPLAADEDLVACLELRCGCHLSPPRGRRSPTGRPANASAPRAPGRSRPGVFKPRARRRPGRRAPEHLAALLADAAVADPAAALLVDDQHRRALGGGGVAVAPGEQRDQRRPEVEPLLGEEVLVALRIALVGAPFEDVLVDQPLEPRREHVAGDAEPLLQLVEAPPPVHHVADDQQRPALADDLERLGDRADLARVVVAEHECDLGTLVA